MRARELEGRIDFALEIHDRAVQRLFGISLALSGDGELNAGTRERCSAELQAALHDLRDAVQLPLGRRSPPTSATARLRPDYCAYCDRSKPAGIGPWKESPLLVRKFSVSLPKSSTFSSRPSV